MSSGTFFFSANIKVPELQITGFFAWYFSSTFVWKFFQIFLSNYFLSKIWFYVCIYILKGKGHSIIYFKSKCICNFHEFTIKINIRNIPGFYMEKCRKTISECSLCHFFHEKLLTSEKNEKLCLILCYEVWNAY